MSDPDKLLGELLEWAEERDRDGHDAEHIVSALDAAAGRLRRLGWEEQ